MAADTPENRTPLPGGCDEWVSELKVYKGAGGGLFKTFICMDANAERTWTYSQRVLKRPRADPDPLLIIPR